MLHYDQLFQIKSLFYYPLPERLNRLFADFRRAGEKPEIVTVIAGHIGIRILVFVELEHHVRSVKGPEEGHPQMARSFVLDKYRTAVSFLPLLFFGVIAAVDDLYAAVVITAVFGTNIGEAALE